VDGIVSFATMADVTKPFTIRHGLDKAEFRFSEAAAKALAAPAPAPAAQ
jgi:hypothetical protein